MKKIPYCVPEIIEAVLCTAKNVSDELFIHKKVLNTVIDKISRLEELGDSPYELMRICLRCAYKALGVTDPYEDKKELFHAEIMALAPWFTEHAASYADVLEASLNIAAVLNYKGFSSCLYGGRNIEKRVKRLLQTEPIAASEIEEFRRIIRSAENLLYVTASAGEIAADKELVQILSEGLTVTVAVAPQPILFRAVLEDARRCGLTDIAAVIDPGADMYGINLEKASSEFRDAFKSSDVVLVKGGVNARTLSGCGRDYFILGSGYISDEDEDSEFCKESTIIRKYLKYVEA